MKHQSPPQAQEFMTRHVQTVTPEMSLEEVVRFLKSHHVSNAPVVQPDEQGAPILIGFISEGDCLAYLANEVFFGSPSQAQTVSTMMRRHPVCVEPDMDIFALASVFVNHRYRHLPVVHDGRLLGIVSRRDILQALDAYYRKAIRDRDMDRFPPDLHEVLNLRFVTKGR
jgi:CBS domain-containing protein